MANVTITVNGKSESREVEDRTLLVQFLRSFARCFEADDGGKRGFVARAVRALRLAQCLRIADHVENVVLHLERQADAFGIGVERLELFFIQFAGAQCGQLDAGADQRAGLVNVHGFQLGDVERSGRAFSRLMLTHDTGSAIVGPARGDIFVGSGDAAGSLAGRMQHAARMIALVPHGASPAP